MVWLSKNHLDSAWCGRAFRAKRSEFQGLELLFAPLRSHFYKPMSLILKMPSSTGTLSVAATRSGKMFYSLFTLVKNVGLSVVSLP